MISHSHKQPKLAIFLSFVLTILVSPGSQAEDIEIYQAIFNAQGNTGGITNNDPNVLFMLDNSLSMDDYRLINEGGGTPVGEYDPDEVYSATGDRDTNVYLYDTNMAYQGISINTNQNDCRAARNTFISNPNYPVHQDKYIEWRTYGTGIWGWTIDYYNSTADSSSFECEDDNGVHGRSDGASNKYPRICGLEGLNACSTNKFRALYRNSQQFSDGTPYPWGFVNTERRMVDGNYHGFLLYQASSSTVSEAACSANDQILTATDGTKFRCLQKLVIMKRALLNVIEGDSADADKNGINDINLGLMRFNKNNSSPSGGTLVDAIAAVNDRIEPNNPSNLKTNRDDFVDKVKSIQFEVKTPLAESMFEAYRYFTGGAPEYSELSTSVADQDALDPDATTGPDDNSGNFISPRTNNQCQGNYTVLLSDGKPTSDTSANSDIRTLYNDAHGTTISACGDSCLDEMTATLKESLSVYTYTIGFDLDDAADGVSVLKDAAKAGSPEDNPVDGDGYFQASDITSLESVFARILTDIQTVDNDSFIAPAVTVNAFNRLQNRSDIYYAVFAPEAHTRWAGNLKKYKVGSNAQILDSEGVDAISAETGFFTDESKSFWSDQADGPNVQEGGFAAELTVPRNLYASLDTATTAVTSFGNADISSAITNFANAVEALDNTGEKLGVLNTLMGTFTGLATIIFGGGSVDPLTTNVEQIIRWTLGEDVDLEQDGEITDPNKFAGESLHSTPFVLSYGTTATEPKDVVYMTSNQGLLHAITGQDASESGGTAGQVGGSERWAYLPDPDLMENFGAYYNKELNGSFDHEYGLDGEIASRVERDASQNVSLAHLFIGQRRGGNKYFGIDVTDGDSASNPVKKLWTLEGGTGDFTRMGQTWAKPVVSSMNVCTGTTCVQKKVLVLGGGYDTDYDDASKTIASLSDDTSAQDTLGNAIYIVDAETKDLLWMASNTNARVRTGTDDVVVAEMDHSIPSAPTVLDIDKDGSIDTIFAIDVAGQIFRFDFQNNAAGTAVARSGGRIANLQETGVKRRFYNPVDAVVLPSTDDGAQARIALVTGSGYRAHPLAVEGIANRFYVIYDSNIGSPALASGAANYAYVESDAGATSVIDVGSGDITELTSTTTLEPGSTHKYGYFVELGDSTVEKIINPTLIADFQVLGVSYKPSTTTTSLCSAAAGTSSAYRMDLLTGEVATVGLVKPGVSAAPVVVYLLETDPSINEESLKPVVIIGTEPFEGEEFKLKPLELGKARKRAWWELDRRIGE